MALKTQARRILSHKGTIQQRMSAGFTWWIKRQVSQLSCLLGVQAVSAVPRNGMQQLVKNAADGEDFFLTESAYRRDSGQRSAECLRAGRATIAASS